MKHDPVWVADGYEVVILDIGYHTDEGFYELTEEAEKIYEECGAYEGEVYSEYMPNECKLKVVYKKKK